MSADVPPPGASMALLVEELTVVAVGAAVAVLEDFLRGIFFFLKTWGQIWKWEGG